MPSVSHFSIKIYVFTKYILFFILGTIFSLVLTYSYLKYINPQYEIKSQFFSSLFFQFFHNQNFIMEVENLGLSYNDKSDNWTLRLYAPKLQDVLLTDKLQIPNIDINFTPGRLLLKGLSSTQVSLNKTTIKLQSDLDTVSLSDLQNFDPKTLLELFNDIPFSRVTFLNPKIIFLNMSHNDKVLTKKPPAQISNIIFEKKLDYLSLRSEGNLKKDGLVDTSFSLNASLYSDAKKVVYDLKLDRFDYLFESLPFNNLFSAKPDTNLSIIGEITSDISFTFLSGKLRIMPLSEPLAVFKNKPTNDFVNLKFNYKKNKKIRLSQLSLNDNIFIEKAEVTFGQNIKSLDVSLDKLKIRRIDGLREQIRFDTANAQIDILSDKNIRFNVLEFLNKSIKISAEKFVYNLSRKARVKKAVEFNFSKTDPTNLGKLYQSFLDFNNKNETFNVFGEIGSLSGIIKVQNIYSPFDIFKIKMNLKNITCQNLLGKFEQIKIYDGSFSYDSKDKEFFLFHKKGKATNNNSIFRIKSGEAKITNFGDKNQKIFFSVLYSTTTSDIISEFQASKVNYISDIDLDNTLDPTGGVDGIFNFVSDGLYNHENFVYSFNGELEFKELTVITSLLLEHPKISTLDYDLTQSSMNINFTGEIEEQPFRGQFSKAFIDSTAGVLNVSTLIRYRDIEKYFENFPIIYSSGYISIDLSVVFPPSKPPSYDIMFDLEDTKLDVPLIGLKKKKGEKGVFSIGGVLSKKSNFNFRHEKYNISGTLEASINAKKLQLKFNQIKLDDFFYATGDYSVNSSTRTLSIKNAFFDYRNAPSGLFKKVKNRLNIVGEFATIKLSDNISLTNSEANFDLKNSLNGNLKGFLNSGPELTANFLINDSLKRVEIESVNAGEVLLFSKFYKSGYGGSFYMSAEQKQGEKLSGSIVIKDLRVKGAPTLATILAATSIEGLIDLLENKGIVFATVSSDFRVGQNEVEIYNGVASNSALSVTLEGVRSFTENSVSYNGVVSPLYLINSVVKEIPIIGSFLGGNPGEGAFGFNYEIEGLVSSPTVMVNPLSIFTPGQLRELVE